MKQGRFLPGTRIPILAPERLAQTKPDCILVLPWSLREEISQQLEYVRSWGGRLVCTIPALEAGVHGWSGIRSGPARPGRPCRRPGDAAVLPLHLPARAGGPFSVLAIGAHPDDIEIGSGGLLLGLAESRPELSVRYVVLTGTPDRQAEARNAASAFLPGAELTVELHDLPEGRLPAAWSAVKELLEDVARSGVPDLIIAPSPADAHQDHRTIGELVPTVFRDQLCLAYEIPKWDGDIGRPAMYFPMTEEAGRHKVELLHKCFPSQRGRDWWDDEVFLGLARLRGMECRARYAEAFYCGKLVIVPCR